MGEPRFRRTVIAVALLHAVLLAFFIWWSVQEVRKPQVTWLAPEQFLPPEEEQPEPTPMPEPEETPRPDSTPLQAKSEIPLPTPTPTP
ncbi:MAG: hypothetical protein IAE97_10265, partial [Chthoniobacterales bacterium]|nr:hypothetical protein [Chthoniobacterales bacterium]